jgi:hypothetical protein
MDDHNVSGSEPDDVDANGALSWTRYVDLSQARHVGTGTVLSANAAEDRALIVSAQTILLASYLTGAAL